MPVSGNIPSLIGGVSQQPAALRAPNQLNEQINCYSSAVDGLHDRPPLEHVARVYDGNIGDIFSHLSNRDVNSRYEILILNGLIRVLDLRGTSKFVDVLEGSGSYLVDDSPSTTFKVVTVADTTFIVNTKKVVRLKSDLSTVRPNEAMVFVRQGNYGSTYNVYINNVLKGTYTTSDTDPGDIATDIIATNLAADLVAAGYTITRAGSTIHIVKASGDFTIRVEDSQGGNSLKCFKTTARMFSELPETAPDGYVLAIDANPDTQGGKYYVKFAVSSAGETFAQGTWTETLAPGIKYKLDPATMPHKLVPLGDGTFTFSTCVWGDRLVGDETTNPSPSFVDDKINEVFFYKNRLSFFADENFIMSETFEPFNFWRTTVTDLLDSDRVDARVAHDKVSVLKHAIAFNTHCVFFSDQTQFRMLGENAITPRSVKADPQTSYENEPNVKPVSFGKSLFFGATAGDWSSVWELMIDSSQDTLSATNVSAHVPKYIPAGLYKFAISTLEQVLVCLTRGDRSSVYVYKYLWNDKEQKIQSSWSKWTWPGLTILAADFVGTELMLLVQYPDGVYLMKIDVAPGRTDPNSLYVTHLDRRLTNEQISESAYDPISNKTTFYLPYPVTADDPMRVVTRHLQNQGTFLLPGKYLSVVSQGTFVGRGFIVVMGDRRLEPLWIGHAFYRSIELSTIFKKKQTPSGSLVNDETGRLQLLRGTVTFDNTGYFVVEVTPDGRATSTYIHTGRVVGDLDNVLGKVALRSGTFNFGILSHNKRTKIVIKTDGFLPMRLSAIDWEGTWTTRSQGI